VRIINKQLMPILIVITVSINTFGCFTDNPTEDITNSVCGNGQIESPEVCDSTSLNNHNCTTIDMGFTGGTLTCNSECNGWDTAECTLSENCGNQSIDTDETCDGSYIGQQNCTTIDMGFIGGTLACNSECNGWDTTECTVSENCGNETIDLNETCDGTYIGEQNCTTIGMGFIGGTLLCNSGCTGWNTDGCIEDNDCGNGSIDTDEYCDGTNLDEQDCTSIGLGYTSGTLACNSDCSWDKSGCIGTCNNWHIDPGEVCDGVSMGGQICTSIGMGFTGGILTCNLQCDGYNTSKCVTTCGNGLLDTNEWCDGLALGGNDCASINMGFIAGTLGCNDLCTNWDYSQCYSNSVCDDGVISRNETCEDNDLSGHDCSNIFVGYTGGTLSCNDQCNGWDTTECTDSCGDGLIQSGEWCDNSSLNGQNCTTIGKGFSGGTLACDDECNGWDTTNCTGGTSCGCTTDCDWQNADMMCIDGLCATPQGSSYHSLDAFPISPCTPGPGCFGTDTTIDVPDSFTITSVIVYVDVTQDDYNAAMQLTLSTPGGEYFSLTSDNPSTCGLNDMYVGAFPTTFVPENSMVPIIGTNSQGTWTLNLYDMANSTTVSLNRWTLYLQ
jgi:Proprotein convertase P-domain